MPGAAVGMFHGLHSPIVHEGSCVWPPTPFASQTQRVSAPTQRPQMPREDETPTCPFIPPVFPDCQKLCNAKKTVVTSTARIARSGTMRTWRICITS